MYNVKNKNVPVISYRLCVNCESQEIRTKAEEHSQQLGLIIFFIGVSFSGTRVISVSKQTLQHMKPRFSEQQPVHEDTQNRPFVWPTNTLNAGDEERQKMKATKRVSLSIFLLTQESLDDRCWPDRGEEKWHGWKLELKGLWHIFNKSCQSECGDIKPVWTVTKHMATKGQGTEDLTRKTKTTKVLGKQDWDVVVKKIWTGPAVQQLSQAANKKLHLCPSLLKGNWTNHKAAFSLF